ncbi:MAG TPA: DUF692 domain-containing protein [Thermoanaerobaculia bacterium]|nr:DUF692 domain-containing protein [Thermoanaerobaculia bacterium]
MKYGLGWRRELGAGILANLDSIEVLEVLAEELFDADASQRRAFRFLRAHVPIVLHATSLGLASPERVDARLLDRIARVVEWLEPELWSEHLAFVRADGIEVGHLAAPPRNDATLAGLVRNVEEARRVVGSLPVLENVASLIDPPCSTYDEQAWLHAVLGATPCDLLLDLHNVYANAENFGFDAAALVASLPMARVRLVHLAGGKRIERGRVLDDHLHRVPEEVFALLALVEADAYVILERDGNYPAVEELLAELRTARGGGLKPALRLPPAAPGPNVGWASARPAETALLARLYTDDYALNEYLQGPNPLRLDPDDLRLAARSFARKRAMRH